MLLLLLNTNRPSINQSNHNIVNNDYITNHKYNSHMVSQDVPDFQDPVSSSSAFCEAILAALAAVS